MKLPFALSDLLKRLAAPLVVALAVMFAIAPAADALVCGSDDERSASQVSSAQADQELPAKPDLDGHAVCSHGHCHHAPLAVPGSIASDAEPLVMAEARLVTTSAAATSTHLSGVERPPRV